MCCCRRVPAQQADRLGALACRSDIHDTCGRRSCKARRREPHPGGDRRGEIAGGHCGETFRHRIDSAHDIGWRLFAASICWVPTYPAGLKASGLTGLLSTAMFLFPRRRPYT